MSISFRATGIFFLLFLLTVCAFGEDWPQLQKDAGHTGYTSETVAWPPYRLKWQRDLNESIATAAQLIVADGKVFIGTSHSNMYALNRSDGTEVWKVPANGPVISTAAYDSGKVFFSSMDHFIYALDASDGTELWRFETGEGIWASPVVANGMVFVAGRDGYVYGLNTLSGAQVWKEPVGGLVMNTPGYCDGTLFVAAGDMKVYAYRGTDGYLEWVSPKLDGAAFREFWVVAVPGSVIVVAEPPYIGQGNTQERIQTAVLDAINAAHWSAPVLMEDAWGYFPGVAQWFTNNPIHRTHFVLDPNTGAEKFVVPVVPASAGGSIAPPPAVRPDNQWAYTHYTNVFMGGGSEEAFLGRFNLVTGEMDALLDDFYIGPGGFSGSPGHEPPVGVTWPIPSPSDYRGGFLVQDHTYPVIICNNILIQNRMSHFITMFNIDTRDDLYLDGSGPLVGRFSGQYHSTVSPVVVSDGEVFCKDFYSGLFVYEPGP